MSAAFADWVAICETKARYCRCLDSKDWQGYAEVFTEDLELDTSRAGGFVVKGRNDAIRAIRAAVETAKTAHQVHNPEVAFDGPAAAHYHEHYVKGSDGVWRIKRQALSYLTFDIATA